jgi:YgiT-type zinc finger domain-containing protein
MKPYGDCIYCGGEVVERLEEIDYRHKGELFVLRNVPTGVCTQCGEQFFTADVAREMEASVQIGPSAAERISVPVIEKNWA